jgi:adenylate cyclase
MLPASRRAAGRYGWRVRCRCNRSELRVWHLPPPGGVLISFETYAHVKDDVQCEERGHVRIKGIAQPVATYAVVGLKQDAEQAGTAHLRLELDADRMSDDERKSAADALRRALELLEKDG